MSDYLLKVCIFQNHLFFSFQKSSRQLYIHWFGSFLQMRLFTSNKIVKNSDFTVELGWYKNPSLAKFIATLKALCQSQL
jgi:hypothetical protein